MPLAGFFTQNIFYLQVTDYQGIADESGDNARVPPQHTL